ncbi:MAG: metallophosphoesterase [Lachnospiraceae bacterium]
MLRVRFSILGIVFVLVTLSGCGVQSSKDTKEDFTIFIATDIHYLSKDLYVEGSAFESYNSSGDGKLIQYTDEIVQSLGNEMKEQEPDVLIISGDLTNNGEKESHLDLAERLEEIEEETGTKILVIPGNHDIANPWARGFSETEQYVTDMIGPDDFETIYQEFGYSEAISKDTDSLSYLSAPADEVWFLMLDTCIYDFNELLGSPTPNGDISEETFSWIRECSKMAEESGAQIVTVMHHNLLKHNKNLYYGFTLDNNEQAMEVFRECGLELVLSGHIHLQDIMYDGEKEQDRIYDITTSALSVYPLHYGILEFTKDTGYSYHTESVDVNAWAKENGSKENLLLNFNEYAKNYFSEISYNKAYDALTQVEEYTQEEMSEMAETMSILNTSYFSGDMDSVKEEVKSSKGYLLWQEASELEFLKNYILEMMESGDEDNNELQIQFETER